MRWNHLAAQPVAPAYSGYNILVAQPTRGLFPGALAVTRVAIEIPNDEMYTARPYLLTDPRNEFLRWNSTLDNQMAISEVFPIAERDLGGGQADPEQILAAFRALHAQFGLVYAVNELSGNETEMFGVLYDARTAQPIVSLHAQAVSVTPPDEENDTPENLWKTDSRALVRAQFEDLLHACVRELIMHDQPATVDPPSGWTPASIRPVEWPPKRFRRGR